jgi:flavin-binding protein dodecin
MIYTYRAIEIVGSSTDGLNAAIRNGILPRALRWFANILGA